MKNKLLAGLFFLFLSYLGYGQTITVTINPDNPPICSGAEVTLDATASGGTAPYTYSWSTGDVGPVIRVNKAGTYTVTVRDAANLPGNRSVTVRAVTQPNAPTAVNESGAVCRGGTARLSASAPGGDYEWFDANFQYKGSGPVYNTDAITQNTVFYARTTVDGCPSPFSRPIPVTIIADPVVSNVTICPGTAATFTATGADTYQWYDAAGNVLPSNGSGTFTTAILTTSATFFVTGTTNGCTSEKVRAQADVKAATQDPNGGGPYNVCFGSKKTLTAFGVPGAVYEWFKNIDDTEALIASPDYTTPILTQNETYYVQATLNGCTSGRIRVDVIVSMPPSKPEATSNGPVCYNTTAQLRVVNQLPDVVYKWYTSLTSAEVYLTGAEITTKEPLLANTTFYVRAETGGGTCLSAAEPVPVTVRSQVALPEVIGATAVCAGTITLKATSPDGSIFNWYGTRNGTPVPGSDFTATVNADRSFFVSVTTADGCVSDLREVQITIIPPPVAPQATDGSTCIGGKATLIATTGTNHIWYDSGGAQVGSGSVFETPVLTTTTNYSVASVSSTGCEGARTPVRAIVIAKPARPTAPAPAGPVCARTSTILTASGSTGRYRWYTTDVGGSYEETVDFTTPILNNDASFWVTAVTPEGCESDRRRVDVNVIPVVRPQFLYSSGTYCSSDPNPVPTKFIPGAFSATAGLVITASTGRINLAASTPGTHTVTFTPSSGGCNTPTSVVITITATPDARFTYPQNDYCGDASNPLPIFEPGASAGVFSSTAGLVFINATTGQINLEASTPGVYTIFNTVTTNCDPPVRESFEITIREAVVVSAGPNRPVQVGGDIQLAGSVNLTGLGVTWTSSNPADFFSNPNIVNPIYRPAATSGTVTLTLTTDNPPGICGRRSDEVVITIVTKPVRPTAAPQSVCYNEKANLSATAPGGLYQWYDQETGGSPIGSGPNFRSPDPLTADRFFYVSTTINGVESDRTRVPVTVKAPLPVPDVTGGGAVCPGRVDLEITTTADEYRWYDANGDRKSTFKTYSPTITQNTRFFVQIVIAGCEGQLFPVDITVNPTTTVDSDPTDEVCSGAPQNYTITALNTAATFRYSRDAVDGISNEAAVNVLASQITEPLINTTDNEKIVEYIITPYLGDCAGTPFSYKVTVLPTPAIQSATEITACNRASVGYFVDIRPNVASYFSWSREAKDGISNAAVSGQESRNIQESLENTTNLPIDVYYTFTYGTASCEGTPFTLKVTVNPAVYVNSDPDKQVCSGEPVAYNITSNVDQLGATFKWIRVNDLDGHPRGTDYTFSNTINEILINNSVTDVQHAYYSIIPILGDCEGEAFPFHVILKPAVKKPDVRDNGPVCLDKEIILHTDLVAGAQYLWTTSTGIINQRTDLPSLAIPATSAGPVKYYVTVVLDGCSNTSDEESLNVNQKPTVDVGEEQRTLCPDETRIPLNGQAFGNVDGSPIAGRWTKVKGSGIIELDGTIKANAYIPSAEDKAPGAEPVVLQFQSANGDDCEPAIKLVTLTFEQARPTDTEAERTLEKCSGEQVNYEIVTTGDAAANITYSWVRADDPTHNGISKRIDEILVNNGTTDITFIYNITASIGSCVGETFPLRVTVKPAIAKPDFSYPQTVCVNKPFELTYLGNVANATFIWIGPDGTRQPETTNPTLSVAGISSPDQASFTLIIKVGNCEVASEQHTVDITPIPVVNAGADMPYCPDVSTIPLNGIVTRGVNGPPSDGIWVVLTGKGQFASDARVLNNQYQVHPDDIATGVVLQLQSTDNCDGVTPDVVTFTFQAVKVANAGPDREACEQRVQLNGSITAPSGTGRWEGGEGVFTDGRTSLTTMYIPSLNEVNARRVVLRLIADDNSLCNEKTDEVVITLLPPPTVMADASPVRYVVKGRTITLNPVVSEENLIYTWTESPMVGGISNTAIKNPVITGSGVDVTYTLTVTNPLLCESESSSVLVRASPQLEPKNTFTPNADGINDIWVIDGVEAYPNVVVDIYTRAGQLVYHSVGYAQPWDGTSNGKPVPFGVYYFVIDTKEVEQKVTGYVTVIR